VRLIQLFWALPGVLVPLLGAHLPSQAEREAMETPDVELPPHGESAVAPVSVDDRT
jgi:ADP-ribose pyrophosphatase YjhB (NUDIX family)